MKRIPLLIFLSVFLASCATMDLDKLEKTGSGSRLADLTEDTTLAADGIFYEVKDPSGTPLDRKVTAAEIAEYVLSTFTEDVDYQGVLSEGPFVDGDKTDHDAVVLLVDQDVTSGSAPTLLGTNFTLIPAGALATTQDWSGLNITFPAMPTLTLLASELNDTSDPHTVTANELKNFFLTNYESTGGDEWDMPATAEGEDNSFFQEAAQIPTLDPNGTEQNWFRRNPALQFTQLAAGEAIVGSGSGKSQLDCKSTENGRYCTGDEGFDAASTYVPVSRTLSKCFTALAVTASSDWAIERFDSAITITDIYVYQNGATNVIGGLDECTGSGGTCGSVTAVDSDITGTDGAEVQDDGSLTNGGIAAGNRVMWHTTSVSGTNTDLNVCFDYTID